MSEERCETGQTKKIECNNCFCANGQWACTLIGCNVHIPTEVRHLNLFVCDDGKRKCTNLNCGKYHNIYVFGLLQMMMMMLLIYVMLLARQL